MTGTSAAEFARDGAVGVLGGTFDPVHHGHLRLALEVREALGLAEVRLMPTALTNLRNAASASTAERLAMLERLRGESEPTKVLTSVPGIGPQTADRIHHELGIETLEDLEAAAHDGRLALLGFGPKRLAGIRDSLAHRLQRIRPPTDGEQGLPPVEEILDVDREYREKAVQGALVRIAPRRFNPQRLAWLPILHTTRGSRHYTALFSNTALAHRLGRTNDWVILYWDDGHHEHQCTVVTRRGPLGNTRVVRGRELDTARDTPRTHVA